ncbi:unnamed protein product [Ambrosiozyma monospora]|uniref:Unnamed protein product n=1 Tax=Ambrosiozyma monospora TaxID=43982 RepID=A0A9W6YSJ2_AMBMO|nr:unnamed protein product [Ambrosiozyma monospora]
MSTFEYTFEWPSAGFNDVFLAGSFDHWTKQHKLIKDPVNGTFSLTLGLPDTKEKILYKFVADGNWLTSDKAKVETDASGNLNNVIEVGGLKLVKKEAEVSTIADTSKIVKNDKENVQRNDLNAAGDEKKSVQERGVISADGDKENDQKSQINISTVKLAENDDSNTTKDSTQVDNQKINTVNNTGDEKPTVLRESQKANMESNLVIPTENGDADEKESEQIHEDADTASAFTSISYPQHEYDIDHEPVVSVPSADAAQVISMSSGETSTMPIQGERETSTDDINSSAQVTLNDSNSVNTKNNGDGTLNSTTSTANTAASARNVSSTSGSTPSKSPSILSRFRSLFRC